MARITVEDCIDKFPSRFELVLVASQRARKLHSGDDPTVDKDNDKNTVIALREIADSTISVEQMKENLIQEYQNVTINDEEDENLVLESENNLEQNEKNDESTIKESNFDKEIENEMNELVSAEDNEIEGQYDLVDSKNEEIAEIVNEDLTQNQEEIEKNIEEPSEETSI